MPEIPQATGPTVQRQGIATPLQNTGMASAAAFGAPIAEGLQRGAAFVDKARQQAEEDRDDTDAMDATNKFIEDEHVRMSDYRNRTGANARGLTDEAAAAYRKSQDEIGGALTTPGSRERFRAMTDRRWSQQSSASLTEHQADQMRRYQVETFGSAIKNLQTDALNTGTPGALQEAERLSFLTRQRQADMVGADPQTTEVAHRQDQEALYSASVDSAVQADNWQAAMTRLELAGTKIPADKRARYEGQIKAGALNQQAQDTADLVTSDPGKTRAEVNAQIATLDDADLRQRVQMKADQEFTRRDADLAEAASKTTERMAKAIESDPSATAESLLIKDPDAASLTQGHRDALRRVEANRDKNREPEPGGRRWMELLNEASASPATFIQRDLWAERGSMPRHEWQQMVDQKARMVAGTLKLDDTDPIPAGVFSTQDIGNRALRGAGIDPAIKNGAPVDPRSEAFMRIYSQAVQARGGNKKLTEKDQEKIAADLMVKHRIAGKGFFGGEIFKEVARFELPGMADAAFTPRDVPAKYNREITEAMRKRGLDASDTETYMEGYRLLLERDSLMQMREQNAEEAKKNPAYLYPLDSGGP